MNQAILDIPDDKIKSFAMLFSQNIVKLPDKTDMPFILYFIGMIGSGKSTTAKFLSTHYNLVRISTDEIRDFLEKNGYSRERSFDVAEFVAAKYLSEGYGVAIDADLVDEYFQKQIDKLNVGIDVPVVILQINTPESVILERLREDNSERTYKGEEAIDDYMHRKSKFDNIQVVPDFVIDGSRDFEDQMQQVISTIDRKLK